MPYLQAARLCQSQHRCLRSGLDICGLHTSSKPFHKSYNQPESAAIRLHLAHMTELARGGTAEVVAVAIRKYKKFKLMFAYAQDCLAFPLALQ